MPHDPDDRASLLDAQRKKSPQSAFHKLLALLLPKNRASPTGVSEDHVLSILAARRGREAALGRELFSDPAWDILLELYAARVGGRRMSLSDLARAIDIPQSTVARWITALAERGLVVSSRDRDETRLWIDLSPHGLAEMKRLLDYWEAAFRSI